MTIYYEEWKEKQYACEECDWRGSAGESVSGRMHRKMFLEVQCPKCSATLDIIIFPESEECAEDSSTLADEQKKALAEQKEQLHLYREQCLQSTDQLPDLAQDEFVILWDQVEGETQLTVDETVIWSEPLAYEGFDRFERIAHILKEKYGSRVKDLVPADRSRLFLHGDYAPSIFQVRKVRRELFGSHATE